MLAVVSCLREYYKYKGWRGGWSELRSVRTPTFAIFVYILHSSTSILTNGKEKRKLRSSRSRMIRRTKGWREPWASWSKCTLWTTSGGTYLGGTLLKSPTEISGWVIRNPDQNGWVAEKF
jgi:hypothetical protein